jgi:hypothetical protein
MSIDYLIRFDDKYAYWNIEGYELKTGSTVHKWRGAKEPPKDAIKSFVPTQVGIFDGKFVWTVHRWGQNREYAADLAFKAV